MTSRRYRCILIIGAPGAGKGTQSRALGQLPGFYWFGTGHVLRSLDPESDLGAEIKPLLERGDLVPSELVFKVWEQHLRQASDRGDFSPQQDIVLLDAFPRDLSQAKLLEPHIDMQLVVYLRVPDDELLKERLRSRNARPDDRSEKTLEHRFRVYHERTTPLMDYYADGRLVEIAADRRPLEVLQQVSGAIAENVLNFARNASPGAR